MNEALAELDDAASFTFVVDDVSPRTSRMSQVRMHEAIKEFVGGEIESCSDYHEMVASGIGYHPLLAAVYSAYSLHHPLVLSPDSLWITVTQGIAHHMLVEGERLRARFVSHQSQLTLRVEVDDWVAGTPENPWMDAFEGWSDQIREHVGEEVHSSLVCDFSTTTPIQRTISQIVMMDIFRRYFRYELYAICGIPSITLAGTQDDWRKLRQKIDGLVKFDIDWWLDDLKIICDQFVKARGGNVDLDHWQNICKLQDAYGGSIINGWVAKLFPYLCKFTAGPCTFRNPIFETGAGFTSFSAPSGLSRVPFKWTDAKSGESRLMEVVGGLTGIKQDPTTGSLEPKAGWAVRPALPLDHLLHRLSSEQSISASEPELQSMYGDTPDDSFAEQSPYPADLDKFYFEVEARRIDSFGQSISLVPQSEVRFIDWGEEQEEHGSSRGPNGYTWFRFATLSDGRFLLINLDINCRDPRPREDHPFDPTFAPIVLSDAASVGNEQGNPVIAFTFREWLESCLDWSKGERKGACDDCPFFWDAQDFKYLGEAEQFTRRKASF